MFIQIHTLTSYPASLLNRDDAGLAKRVPFGNATRLRVSSQCLKRHWRDRLVADLPELPDGPRTRHFFPRAVLPRLLEAGVPQDKAEALCAQLVDSLIGGGGDGMEMSQPVLFGAREAEFMTELAVQAHRATDSAKDAAEALKKMLADREQKKNVTAMSKAASGLTAALFGRFVTSDILARVDAPVHVAHGITVHAADTEMDFFTVVDDLSRDDESGAAHANESELGAGLYYGYVVIDVPLLVSNLTGCEATEWRSQDSAVARRVIHSLVRAVGEQSPGAKLGATAPYSRAECLLLESGRTQPRTLANAYLKALEPKGDTMQQAIDSMATYLSQVDTMYGPTADCRALASVKDVRRFDPLVSQSLDAAIEAVLDATFANS